MRRDAELFATGTVTVTGNDNDLFVSGTRTNIFGSRLRGMVVEEDTGQRWQVLVISRYQITKDFEFRTLVQRSTLRPIGG